MLPQTGDLEITFPTPSNLIHCDICEVHELQKSITCREIMGHKKYLQKWASTQSHWLFFSRKERNTFVLNEGYEFLNQKTPWQKTKNRRLHKLTVITFNLFVVVDQYYHRLTDDRLHNLLNGNTIKYGTILISAYVVVIPT